MERGRLEDQEKKGWGRLCCVHVVVKEIFPSLKVCSTFFIVLLMFDETEKQGGLRMAIAGVVERSSR